MDFWLIGYIKELYTYWFGITNVGCQVYCDVLNRAAVRLQGIDIKPFPAVSILSVQLQYCCICKAMLFVHLVLKPNCNHWHHQDFSLLIKLFLLRDAMHKRGLYRRAVSVCVSVTFVSCATVKLCLTDLLADRLCLFDSGSSAACAVWSEPWRCQKQCRWWSHVNLIWR